MHCFSNNKEGLPAVLFCNENVDAKQQGLMRKWEAPENKLFKA